MAKATLAAGCFWGVEEKFRSINGVIATAVGYTGGHTLNPGYEAVCRGDTGHAEAVQVDFDPDVISFEQLLEAFWDCHDPTTKNRQGPDIGSQYRSAIFTHDAAQTEAARLSLERQEAARRFPRPIVTEIVPATDFFMAEDYHQQYFEKSRRRFGNL